MLDRLFEYNKILIDLQLSMLDRLQLCAQDPDILINGDQKLTDLFLDMAKAFYKTANESSFCPFSINDKTELLIPDKNQKYFIWEQISRSNQPLISKAQTLDFNQDEELHFEHDEDEEEEEEEEMNDEKMDDEKIQNLDDDVLNNFLEEDEEEEKELEGSIDKIHISDEDGDDIDILNDGANEEEYSRLLIESDDPDSHQQISYKDLYGDAPPMSDMDEQELDKDLNETDDTDETLDPKAKQIQEIEQKLISKKPWEMSGETLAIDRPRDSLQDINIEFDFANTEPPEPPATSELEELLIKRIESMNFDDVVRRKKPTESAREVFELNTERSKLGLADEYANDYLKAAQASILSPQNAENNLTPQQKEAINLWRSLEHELNKFTEKRFISKRPKENVTINQAVSLDVEEKPEPTKAPEEIMAPAGSTRQMKGESEITHDERKGERRTFKAKKQKERTAKDAARGILYSQNGGDGAEVKIQQDIDKLMKGNLQGVEVVKPGESISATKQKPKNVNNKFLL